ncbi:hypothetical protein BDD39_002715 [Saccharococcus thermophilus]|uniref:Uncharacterized protein n=1 Tax=Saccharococcus thermophilus TaxID=29396 RepID=A0A846MKR0_9BACL|nr:hypothetical protein [Saccharococcus thermophilus]
MLSIAVVSNKRTRTVHYIKKSYLIFKRQPQNAECKIILIVEKKSFIILLIF